MLEFHISPFFSCLGVCDRWITFFQHSYAASVTVCRHRILFDQYNSFNVIKIVEFELTGEKLEQSSLSPTLRTQYSDTRTQEWPLTRNQISQYLIPCFLHTRHVRKRLWAAYDTNVHFLKAAEANWCGWILLPWSAQIPWISQVKKSGWDWKQCLLLL